MKKITKTKIIILSFIFIFFSSVFSVVYAETAWRYEVKTIGTTRSNFKTLADCQADQIVFNKAKAYTISDCTVYTLASTSNDPTLINNKNVQDQAVDVTPKINVAENKSIYKMLVPLPGITCMDSSGQDTTCISNDIGKYLNVIFSFAIGLCAALAVIMLIIAGVSYMGDESVFGKTEAKKKMFSAILGLIIALGAWALLNTINPDLTGKNGLVIDSANVEIVPLYDRGANDPKQANGESTNCKVVPSGPCSVANLTIVFGAEKAVAMSKICSMESGGNPIPSGTDYCNPPADKSLPVSFGLFQINLTANGSLASTTGLDCSGLFDRAISSKDALGPNKGYICKLLPGKEALYNTCKNRLLDTTINLAIAQSLFNNKFGMGNWNGDKRNCASAFQ